MSGTLEVSHYRARHSRTLWSAANSVNLFKRAPRIPELSRMGVSNQRKSFRLLT